MTHSCHARARPSNVAHSIGGHEAPIGVGLQRRRGRRTGTSGSCPATSTQRRPLDAALGRRPRRLALEVDDHEVAAGVQHLAEVEVAVHPDARGLDAVARRPRRTARGSPPRARARARRRRVLPRRASASMRRSSCSVGPHLRPHRLEERALVERGERLGREASVVARGEGEVQLGGALAEQLGRVEVRTDGVDDVVGRGSRSARSRIVDQPGRAAASSAPRAGAPTRSRGRARRACSARRRPRW